MAAFFTSAHHLLLVSTIVNFALCKHDAQKPFQDLDDVYSHDTSSLIHNILVENEVIGDVLEDFEPSISLSLHYPDSHESVVLGNDIPVDSVQSRPVFEIHPFNGPHLDKIDEDTIYTLALTDPDATSRSNPKLAEMCHWIVTNITLVPQSDDSWTLSHSSALQPAELVSYLAPSPPAGTGSHRYVFVLLASPKNTSTANLAAPSDRKHWGYKRTKDGKKVKKGKKRTVGVAKWADKMDLEVVGANFFFARNEEQ